MSNKYYLTNTSNGLRLTRRNENSPTRTPRGRLWKIFERVLALFYTPTFRSGWAAGWDCRKTRLFIFFCLLLLHFV